MLIVIILHSAPLQSRAKKEFKFASQLIEMSYTKVDLEVAMAELGEIKIQMLKARPIFAPESRRLYETPPVTKEISSLQGALRGCLLPLIPESSR